MNSSDGQEERRRGVLGCVMGTGILVDWSLSRKKRGMGVISRYERTLFGVGFRDALNMNHTADSGLGP